MAQREVERQPSIADGEAAIEPFMPVDVWRTLARRNSPVGRQASNTFAGNEVEKGTALSRRPLLADEPIHPIPAGRGVTLSKSAVGEFLSNLRNVAAPVGRELARFLSAKHIDHHVGFNIDGVETTAVMRDDIGHRPLFGIPLEATKEAKYIYVGDIVIRSGIRKTQSGLNLDLFDLKEAYNKTNPSSAKNYLQDRGFDTKKMVIKPLNLRKI